MSKRVLVIGNRNYSSWSLRGWLALAKCDVSFDVKVLPLDTPEFEQGVSVLSPTGRVPVFWDGDVCIWDSLAIAEYANETYASGTLWPDDPVIRAVGRSMACEMHSSFPYLRELMPMNCRAEGRKVAMTQALQRDIDRVTSLWTEALSRNANVGPWLLGGFSLCDVMFAPVVFRFRTYGVPLSDSVAKYCAQVLADPDVSSWAEAAREETWTNTHEEVGH